jgi:hypothetical protein
MVSGDTVDGNPDPVVADVALSDVLLAEWRGRAEIAERASAHKEHLLAMQSAAFTQQGRIVLAVGIKLDGVSPAALYLQSNHGDEAETLARLSKSIGPFLKLLALTIRSESGKRARAELERNEVGEIEDLERDLTKAEDERDRVRGLLADLVAENGDAGMSDAWTAADRFLRGEQGK